MVWRVEALPSLSGGADSDLKELCEVLWVCGRRDNCSSTPLHGDGNSQFTTPDAKEQVWANPWHDLMGNC